MKKRRLFLTLLALLPFYLFAQENIPIGSWRAHLPFNSVNSVDILNGKVYAATKLGIFYIDTDNTYKILSKVEGLSDIGISKIKAYPEKNLLLIAYENGNIDIIKDNQILNINDIVRKSILGSKKINNISFYNNLAFLSTDFGVVVLDLIRNEIKESYTNLSASASATKVFSSALFNDSLYLATEKGLLRARFSTTINLMDYNNWKVFDTTQATPNSYPTEVIVFNNKLFAGFFNFGVYYLENNTWFPTAISWQGDKEVLFLTVANNRLFTGYPILFEITPENQLIDYYLSGGRPLGVAILNNEIWVADENFGLLTNKGTSKFNEFKPVSPNGPYSSNVFKIKYLNKNIIALSGGYNSSFVPQGNYNGFYFFSSGVWKNYNKFITKNFPDVFDITTSTYNPLNNTYYFGSHGRGIIAFKDSFMVYNESNSTLVKAEKSQQIIDTRVTGLAIDEQGTLWATNHTIPANSPFLHSFSLDGTWKSYNLSGAYGNPIDVLIDDYGNKWLRLSSTGNTNGLLVFNENTGFQKFFTEAAGSGGLPNRKVNAIAKDNKGEIWIGTDKGVAVYYDPSQVGAQNAPDFTKPLFGGYDLLYDKVVTSIAVDGGNRKWIGTRDGVWLLNETGTEVILQFDVENSPLFSNYILDIEINDETGEVFFATEFGIVSYRGSATGTTKTKQFENVKVFPNPIKASNSGEMAISGLAVDKTIVKITDIYGNMIYETKSEGGTATWNLKDYNGNKALPGIYLIFNVTPDGEEAFVSKVAVLD